MRRVRSLPGLFFLENDRLDLGVLVGRFDGLRRLGFQGRMRRCRHIPACDSGR